ncbi:hypothetical protein [Deinococcus sp. 23YEL01]|uniref:hypothetical protein n=1 Tax=Deinococcus sp. 23YEL01 TaxID=2745871 RepID=UPI001E559316|nr:hypothetical protein [Deinococcus sp. 23YEL01]MCD0169968.1 hypothetical protein [Deinococcus sp. 23YEL01]
MKIILVNLLIPKLIFRQRALTRRRPASWELPHPPRGVPTARLTRVTTSLKTAASGQVR